MSDIIDELKTNIDIFNKTIRNDKDTRFHYLVKVGYNVYNEKEAELARYKCKQLKKFCEIYNKDRDKESTEPTLRYANEIFSYPSYLCTLYFNKYNNRWV